VLQTVDVGGFSGHVRSQMMDYIILRESAT
jgi:hypothetical protein